VASFGVLSTGFVEKTLQDILTEIEDAEKDAFGAGTDVAPDAPLGQINGIVADQLAQLHELSGAIYRALYPDSAEDEALDNVAAITGALRLSPTNTLVTLSLNLDAGTTVPAGSVASNSSTGDRFATDVEVTNAGSDPTNVSVAATAEQTGPVSADAFSIDQIETPVSGWTAQAGIDNANAETYALVDGQTLTVKVDDGAVQTATFNTADFVDIANATAAEVAAVIDGDITGATSFEISGKVRIESDTDGPGSAIEVTGGTANTALGFPTAKVAGLNQSDADQLGSDLESNTLFRLRREVLLSAQGDATIEAILAEVAGVTGVVETKVFENDTDLTDADGIPPHSVEVVVDAPGVTDADIAQAIFESKAAGIRAHGTTISETITDSQGIDHTIGATRATLISIFIDITVATNTDPIEGPVYPADGDTQVAAALVAEGGKLGIDDDVIAERIKCAAFEVDGVIDILVFFIDKTASPVVSDNIPIGSRELSDFDTANVGVTST
jgi:hypothetical protein